MAQPDHAAELEKLRELLRLKDATIANLQQQVAQLEDNDETDDNASDLGSPPLSSPVIERERPNFPIRSPIPHSKSAIDAPRRTWSAHNPFAGSAQHHSPSVVVVPVVDLARVPTPSSASPSLEPVPPITPITSNHGSPVYRSTSPPAQIKAQTLSPASARRKTMTPGQLANVQSQLSNVRRTVSASVSELAELETTIPSTPPLLAAPSALLDWSDDNPFSFLKTPAPPPPSGSGFTHHQHTQSHAHPTRSPPSELITHSHESTPRTKRPRSHSSTMKVRFEIMEPPPPLIPPTPPTVLTELSPQDARRLQTLQAYFRGRLERAKVKHMVEKQVMGRRFTMEEILLSERRYVHHLDLIVNLFLKPLQKTDILTPAEINAIFMNVEKLHQLARSFLVKLEELFTEDPLVIGHRVGLLFLNTIPEWRTYSYLVNHFESAQIQLSKCKERRVFREWMAKAESHTSMEKLGLMDYMIAAAKRVPQYQLLLKAVKKNTPKASRHYQTIKMAKTMISELGEFLNERKRSFDNMRKIELIQRSLNGKIPNLMTTGREFIAEAVVKEEDASARLIIDRHIFLFNDSILVSTASNNKFDRLIYLHGGEMSAKGPRKLILRIDDVSLVISFQTEPEKNRWVSLVGHAIETLTFQESHSVLKEFAPTGIPKPKVLQSVILRQGYLLKHRRSSGGWNKRWFLLEQGILYYVKNPSKIEDITARGTIDLGAYSIRAPLDWTSGGKRRHGFELYSPRKPVFVLASEDPRSRDEWVQALRPFLQSSKSSERDGILFAASSSSDVARTATSSRVLLPTLKQNFSDDDLIQWSDTPACPPPASTSTSTLSLSSKFYFNEDHMDRSTVTEEDTWFTQVSQLPSPSKISALRRSMSSSSVASSN